MAFELTREQQAVVDNRGGNLLVSAAAGSGKTRVLVERLMNYVKNGANIDRFLIITFTNAAAAELRDRIAQGLSDLLAEDPGSSHLRKNSNLVYKTQISTIDAFCLDFLRECGEAAGLDPDFRLCDEAEGRDLGQQAMETVLERRYASMGEDAGFQALVDALAGDRDDQTLEDVIYDVYRRIQSHPDPMGWLEARKADYRVTSGQQPEDTVWGRILLEDAAELTDYWVEELNRLRQEIQFDPVLDANYGPSLDATLAHLWNLRAAIDRGWDETAARFPVPFPRVGTKRGADPGFKEQVKRLRELCKKQMTRLGERFDVTAAEAMEDLAAIGPAMVTLLEVTAEYDREFTALKRQRRLMDFSDGEHLTARLLAGENGVPSQLAVEWSKRYQEIMVDEYQDTNAVQNVIFDALSTGDNLFMVGDVKQSIYRFRLADPTIFLSKYANYAPYEVAEEGEGRSILLSRNFRSRPEVLEGTNFIFRNVMTAPVGEMDYTDAEALVCGREDLAPDGRYRVELDCVDLSDLTDDEEAGKAEKDLVVARATAARIRELLAEGLPVNGRPVTADDVVILLRSPGPVLRCYTRALEEAGIPWQAEESGGFFDTTEISVAMSWLQIIDNPRQDVPLLAVLRSPVCNMSPDRLARLRGEGKGSIYQCLAAGRDRGEADCAEFLHTLDTLRSLAAEESSHRLLWRLYEMTDMPAVFAGLPEGGRRRANLMALYDAARRFEGAGHKGLFRFLLHLSRMVEHGQTIPVEQSGGRGVRILSIHKSKGLEFPVVFLCGLERKFNDADAKTHILFHEKLGLGPRRVDRNRMIRYTTIAREAVALQLRRQLRAEELRLLYVAMTRAEHKLFLVTAVNGGRGEGLSSLALQAQCPPAPRRMAQADSMAEWVLTPALCRGDSTPLWRDVEGDRPAPAPWQGPAWEMRLLSGAAFERPPAAVKAEAEAEAVCAGDTAEMAARFGWSYPHAAGADMPSKLTATQLKGRSVDAEISEESAELQPRAQGRMLRYPVFGEERPLSPAEKGTALHMTMQYLDFGKTGSREEIAAEVDRLREKQFITEGQSRAVPVDAICAFFASPLGQELRRARRVEREFKFSMLVPARDYLGERAGEEELLLQGVVDCWFEGEDGTVTVLDFKTDRVTEATVEARAREYRPQLDAYARAMSEVMELPVGRKVLWFFAVDHEVSW